MKTDDICIPINDEILHLHWKERCFFISFPQSTTGGGDQSPAAGHTTNSTYRLCVGIMEQCVSHTSAPLPGNRRAVHHLCRHDDRVPPLRPTDERRGWQGPAGRWPSCQVRQHIYIYIYIYIHIFIDKLYSTQSNAILLVCIGHTEFNEWLPYYGI